MLKENQEKYSTHKEQENWPRRGENLDAMDIAEPAAKVLENIIQRQPGSKEERLQKMYLQEQLSDIVTSLREGDGDDTLNLIVAYRGLEQAKKQFGSETDDFGIDNAMNGLREKIRDIEGFDLDKVEDLDQVFEKARGEVKEAIKHSTENLSEEEASTEKNIFERYFVLKKEIQARQRQILGESKSFYRGISEKVSGPLIAFLTEKGVAADEQMKDSRYALLQYIGKYNAGSKFARGAAIGIIAASALGYIFKGDIVEAAEHRHGERLDGEISPDELRLKQPEIYQLLQEQGFIKMAGMTLEKDDNESGTEKREKQTMPRILEDIARYPRVEKLLTDKEYKKTDLPEELRMMYDKFNDKDSDPSDEAAVAIRYNQFLNNHSREELIKKYGETRTEKIYQEAGYVTFKSLEGCFNKDTKDGTVDSDTLTGYLDGFKKASDFYKNSLELSKEYTRDGKLNKEFAGLIEMNDVLANIANTAMIYGDEEDKITAAKMRMLASQNTKQFKRLKGEVDFVYMGDGRFLIPDVKNLAVLKGALSFERGEDAADYFLNGWVKHDMGGYGLFTSEIIPYINKVSKENSLSEEDTKLIKMLTDNKILIKTEGGFAVNEEKPFVLFSDINAYTHEVQHYEFLKNNNLIKYWIEEWNAESEKFRGEFIKSLKVQNTSTKEEFEALIKQVLSFEKTMDYISDSVKGVKTKKLDDLRYQILQEFQAYSSDNEKHKIFDEKHEIE